MLGDQILGRRELIYTSLNLAPQSTLVLPLFHYAEVDHSQYENMEYSLKQWNISKKSTDFMSDCQIFVHPPFWRQNVGLGQKRHRRGMVNGHPFVKTASFHDRSLMGRDMEDFNVNVLFLPTLF